MNVKEIIKTVCVYLDLKDLKNTTTLGGAVAPSDAQTQEIETLLNCLNFTLNTICAEYYELRDLQVHTTKDGVLNFAGHFDGKKVNHIISVKDKYGNRVVYKVFPTYIKTIIGTVHVLFSYLPTAVALSGTINFLNTKISERILAYGVASEYSFIKGLYDDAAVWDARFKNSLTSVLAKRGEIAIKNRRWL